MMILHGSSFDDLQRIPILSSVGGHKMVSIENKVTRSPQKSITKTLLPFCDGEKKVKISSLSLKKAATKSMETVLSFSLIMSSGLQQKESEVFLQGQIAPEGL